jgi:hypothetical protein
LVTTNFNNRNTSGSVPRQRKRMLWHHRRPFPHPNCLPFRRLDPRHHLLLISLRRSLRVRLLHSLFVRRHHLRLQRQSQFHHPAPPVTKTTPLPFPPTPSNHHSSLTMAFSLIRLFKSLYALNVRVLSSLRMFVHISLNTTRRFGLRWTFSSALTWKYACCIRSSHIPLAYQRKPSRRLTVLPHLSPTTYNALPVVIVISLRRPSISTGVLIPRPQKHERTSNASSTTPTAPGSLSNPPSLLLIHKIRGLYIPNKPKPLSTRRVLLHRRRTSAFFTSFYTKKNGSNASTATSMKISFH